MAHLRNAVAKAGNLAHRTVHIKLFPTASSFAERMEVLRVLERFGEVQWFKSLKYDARAPVSNAFLSLFATEESAKELINASPLRYRLIAEPHLPSPATDSSDSSPAHSSTLPTDQSPSGHSSTSSTPPSESAPSKEFEIHINASTYPHASRIAASPLYGQWEPINHRFSRVAGDLRERVPVGIARKGLCDWETARKIMSTANGNGDGGSEEEKRAKREEREFRRKFGRFGEKEESGGARGVPWRILRKMREEGGGSLRG